MCKSRWNLLNDAGRKRIHRKEGEILIILKIWLKYAFDTVIYLRSQDTELSYNEEAWMISHWVIFGMGPLCISNFSSDFPISNVIKRRLGRHWQATSHHASEIETSHMSALVHRPTAVLHTCFRSERPTNPLSPFSLCMCLSQIFSGLLFSTQGWFK